MGKIIYLWNPLIRAIRVGALFCRNWVPLAGGEGWKVHLAVDLGSLPFGDDISFIIWGKNDEVFFIQMLNPVIC